MKLKANEAMMFNIPQEIINILNQLEGAGFEAYLVGGCVRDLLMEKKPKDWDITTNAKPEEIQKIFPQNVYENNFGTVGVLTESSEESFHPQAGPPPAEKIVEITPFRVEAKYSDKRHPDEIKFTGKLEEDLARRDFTINAMALNLETHNLKPETENKKNKSFKFQVSNFKIIDLFNGQNDIKNKIIRTVGNPSDRFNEDALRILRAVRFTAELEFEIDKETEKAMENSVHLLDIISKERIRDELIKIIMSSFPHKAFSKMRETGMLKYTIPELEEGWGVTQNKHHIYTVWEHNINALKHSVSNKWPLDTRLASLFHDIGKPRTKCGEGPDSTFYNHEIAGSKMVFKILERLKFSKKLSEKVVKLVRWHLFFSDTEKITLSAVRRIVRNVGEENIWDLMKVRFADRVGMGRPKEEPYRLRKYESMIEEALRNPISPKMLAVKGEDVMRIAKIEPGPKVGHILNILLEEALDDPKLNEKEYLEERVARLSAMPQEDLEELNRKAKKKAMLEEEKKVEEIREKYHVK